MSDACWLEDAPQHRGHPHASTLPDEARCAVAGPLTVSTVAYAWSVTCTACCGRGRGVASELLRRAQRAILDFVRRARCGPVAGAALRGRHWPSWTLSGDACACLLQARLVRAPLRILGPAASCCWLGSHLQRRTWLAVARPHAAVSKEV